MKKISNSLKMKIGEIAVKEEKKAQFGYFVYGESNGCRFSRNEGFRIANDFYVKETGQKPLSRTTLWKYFYKFVRSDKSSVELAIKKPWEYCKYDLSY